MSFQDLPIANAKPVSCAIAVAILAFMLLLVPIVSFSFVSCSDMLGFLGGCSFGWIWAHVNIVLYAVCPACRAGRCLFFEQFCSRRTVAEQ